MPHYGARDAICPETQFRPSHQSATGQEKLALSKHLPRYLAEFSYRFSRRFSLREMFPRLAFVALRTAPMPYRVLKLAENYF